jgi:hypothetical protein
VRVGKPGTEPYRDGAKELTFLATKRGSDADHFFGSDCITAVLEEGNAAVLLGQVRRLEAVLVLKPEHYNALQIFAARTVFKLNDLILGTYR